MRRFGRFHPFPWGARNSIEVLYNDFLDGVGSAYSLDDPTLQGKAMAYARALFEISAGNEVIANLWNPAATQELEQWETTFGLQRNRRFSPAYRRRALALAWLRIGHGATQGNILNRLSDILGLSFDSLVYQTPQDAADDLTSTVPGGLSQVGGTNYSDGPWRAGNKHIAFKFLSIFAEGETQERLILAREFVDSILPATCTFGFIRGDDFTLDTDLNLDNMPLGI